jgi:tripartite-type tricarboxylate transporter receptor subunit TctC
MKRSIEHPSSAAFAALGACALLACSPYALGAQRSEAQAYPSKPVRFIVPFVPGGGTDLTARTIARQLTDKWGLQFVVDNRPGAAGAIGVDLTAKAQPDGYTLCLISASHSVNAAINPKLPYDLAKDLQAVAQATSLFYVVTVGAKIPVKSIKELVAYAKANSGKLNYGSSGTGGLQHFAGAMFGYMAGVDIVHIPYKGGAASVQAAVGGETQIGFTTLTSAGPHIRSGRLRALAITAAKRSPAAPDLPTVAEAGVPGYEVDQWYGVVTAAKVDRALVRKLSAAINEAVHTPQVVKRFAGDGSTPVGSTPEQFAAHIQSEIAKWRKVVKDAKLELR